MSIQFGRGACLLACLLISPAAFADVIYDNGGPDATTGGTDSTVFDSLNPDFTAFDDFVLDEGNTTLTDVHWWGNYYTYFSEQLDDDFQLYIYADLNGAPDLDTGALFTIDGSSASRMDSGLDVGGDTEAPVFAYDLYFDPIELDANVTYWLAITNGFHWRWQTSLEDGSSYQVSGNNFPGDIANWKDQLNVREYDLAFNLTGGIVPEPSTVVLIGAGIAAIFVRQRIRRA
ncbi:MAG: PEP-CTERM sorting domain-containing protein [Candidatus Hydrogenedentes bacterium]|nr:PEP-CTERM sorting domain-containing protein [Candidatus Hydrogenedentota bacterium]